MTFDRFYDRGDITSIQFVLESDYSDGDSSHMSKTYEYYLDWTGDDDYNNEAQNVYVSNAGNLYIVVNENLKVLDIFAADVIDSVEGADLHFDMLDIGRHVNESGEDSNDASES